MTANREDVVVVRAVKDRHGDVVSYSEHVLRGCFVSPGSSTENTDEGEQVAGQWNLYVLGGGDIVASDRVRRPGDPAPGPNASLKARAQWVVLGDPDSWSSPWSDWTPGIVVAIRRVTG